MTVMKKNFGFSNKKKKKFCILEDCVLHVIKLKRFPEVGNLTYYI